MRTLLLLAALACLLAPDARSQVRQRPAPDGSAASATLPRAQSQPKLGQQASTGARSHLLGDQPISIGPDWKATYTAAGLAFTPALGRSAPRTHTLGFRFEGASRGGSEVTGLDLETLPQLVAGAIEYRRSPDLVERYEATPAGLAQSFVFDSRPAGSGDLVVRGRLTTTLPDEHRDRPDALRFTDSENRGVRIETVLGIDADGRTTPGQLRRSGDQLELVLPAEFVDSARLPLVLDPLFGALTQLDDGTIDRDQIDVAAAGAPSGLYGFVHCRYYSATDPDITLYTTTGAAGLFSPTAIESVINTFDQLPKIAYNRDANCFGIVWERRSAPGVLDGEVWCASYALGTGNASASVGLELDTAYTPVIAGDTFAGFDQVVVLWADMGGVFGKAVHLSSTAAPVPDPVANEVSGPGAIKNFAISQDPGVAGRYLFVLQSSSSSVWDVIRLRFVTLAAQPVGPLTMGRLITSPFNDLRNPQVAGDGDEFLVVFTSESESGTDDRDVLARRVSHDPTEVLELAIASSSLPVAKDHVIDESLPAIARSGDQYLATWVETVSEPFGSTDEVWSRPLALDGTAGCGGLERVAVLTNEAADRVQIAATDESGDTATGQAAIAISDSAGDLRFHLWEETAAQPPVNIGGGCGPAMDFELIGDPSIGSTDLIADLRIYDPAPTFAILNVAAGGVEFPCSGCVWVPLRATVLVALEPSAGATRIGSTALEVPCNPALEGAFVDLQFTVLPTTLSPCAISPNLGISDRLRLTFAY